VIGQLLFAPGYAVAPAQCGDYMIHWDAPADACRQLIADPPGFLARSGSLEPVRDVLDRQRRQVELRRLDGALGRRPTADPPPDPLAVVSLQCFVVDQAAAATGAGAGAVIAHEVRIDGRAVSVRELRTPAVRAGGAGPIEVYEEMAALLAGGPRGAASASSIERLAAEPPVPGDLAPPSHLFTRLERLRDADPFLGVRWPLERADLVDVYPFYRHLHRFVDAFRRRYMAERGHL